MAQILLRDELGVKGKGLLDVVAGLQCGKVGRKMAGGKWGRGWCVLRSGGIYGKCGIQFRRREAGDAKFERIEIEILANCDCGDYFHFVDGVDDVDSDGTCGSVDAVRESDGRCFAGRDSFDQSAEVGDENERSDAIAKRECECAVERRVDSFARHFAAVQAG